MTTGLFPAEVPPGAGAARLRRTLHELEQQRLAAQDPADAPDPGTWQQAVPPQRRPRRTTRAG